MSNYTILPMDCRKAMDYCMAPKSVHTVVTSPPYFGLRDYGVDGQLGLEPTPDEFVEAMVEVFRSVRRVLRDDGTVWLNLGDSYVGATSQHKDGGSQGHNSCIAKKTMSGIPSHGRGERNRAMYESGLSMKQLIGIPWRVALALQADGWYLRQDIIWHKPNPMPESVRDRCTKAHEYIFLLTKQPRYYFDSEAIKEPSVGESRGRSNSFKRDDSKRNVAHVGQSMGTHRPNRDDTCYDAPLRNRRSVWTVTTKPFKGAHFATFPPDLIEPCVLAGAPQYCCERCGAPIERKAVKGPPCLVTMLQSERPQVRRAAQLAIDNALSQDHLRAVVAVGAGDAGKAAVTQSGTGKNTADVLALAEHAKSVLGGYFREFTSSVSFIDTPGCNCGVGYTSGTVFDPFGGSGTTALIALKHGRKAILSELNPEYVELAHKRIAGGK